MPDSPQASAGTVLQGIKTFLSGHGNDSVSGRRYLVNEILSLQLLQAAIFGGLAVFGLYWGAQWAVEANHERWATRWAAELNELGAPLYMSDDSDARYRIETFVDNYAEIAHVTYYAADGSWLSTVSNIDEADSQWSPLNAAMVTRLTDKAGDAEPYVFRGDDAEQYFQILAPIWTEEFKGDGLFDFELAAMEAETAGKVEGFVRVDLDFSWYRAQLHTNVRLAVFGILLLILIFGITSRMLLRNSLKSLSDLREPIEALASGESSVQFRPSVHREIAAIVDTIQSTTSALAEKNERLYALANRDSLTGLLNRHRFVQLLEEDIARVADSDSRSALIFLDLDQFKYINDTCGYLAGDQLLRSVADELSALVSGHAQVARFGGDEFAILVPNTTRAEAGKLGNMFVEELRKFSYVDTNVVFHAQCSVGVTMVNSGKFRSDELIAQADIACREAKMRGRNRMEFYSVSGGETDQMAADVGWVSLIREALDTDSFIFRYQPIVHIPSGDTTHHEVLLRMRTPNGDLVSPNAFLPAATRFGLMADIDRWVIENGIAALARFQDEEPELRFTINLSAAAFDGDLASPIRTQIEKYKVRPECLIFEITEQVAVRQLEAMRNEVVALRNLGCKIAIDDFGTGYSSFSYVKELPADYIKIDGSFIKQIAKEEVDQTMVRVIGEIGRAAGMKTIAEYVRNVPSLTILAELGIDYAQGNYVGKPTAKPIRRTLPIPIIARDERKKGAAK